MLSIVLCQSGRLGHSSSMISVQRGRYLSKIASTRFAVAASAIPSVISPLVSNERSSKLDEPIAHHKPSTVITFWCNSVCGYRLDRLRFGNEVRVLNPDALRRQAEHHVVEDLHRRRRTLGLRTSRVDRHVAGLGKRWQIRRCSMLIDMLEGSLITPWLAGCVSSMSLLVIFVGVLASGWLWGMWGLLLGTPLIMAVKSICDHVDDLKPVGELLGE